MSSAGLSADDDVDVGVEVVDIGNEDITEDGVVTVVGLIVVGCTGVTSQGC